MKNLVTIFVVFMCLGFPKSYSQPSLIKAMYPNFDVKLAKEMIDKGSDVNEHSVRCIPLMYAVINKNKEMVELLVKSGAKSDTCSSKSFSNHLGLYLEYGSILETNEKRIIFTPFYYAIKLNQIDIVKLFCDNGYDVTKKMGGTQYTYPIIAATGYGNDEMLNYIIEKGVDLTVKNSEGENALIFSVLVNNLERTKFLIEKGCPVNDISNNGYTPLMYAIEFRGNNVETIKRLINSGADLNYNNIKNQSALSLACLHNRRDVALLLFERGAKATDSQTEMEANARTYHFLGDYYLSKGNLDSAKIFYTNAKIFYNESITIAKKEISNVNKYKVINMLGTAMIIASGNIAAASDANQASANLGLNQSQTTIVYSSNVENYQRMNSWVLEKEPTVFYDYKLLPGATNDEQKLYYKNKIKQFETCISLIDGILSCTGKGLTNQEVDSCIKSIRLPTK